MKKIEHKITPHLWFESQAEEAANFYVSIFQNSRILSLKRIDAGSPVVVIAAQVDR